MKELSLLIEPPVFDLLINPFAYFSIALISVPNFKDISLNKSPLSSSDASSKNEVEKS